MSARKCKGQASYVDLLTLMHDHTRWVLLWWMATRWVELGMMRISQVWSFPKLFKSVFFWGKCSVWWIYWWIDVNIKPNAVIRWSDSQDNIWIPKKLGLECTFFLSLGVVTCLTVREEAIHTSTHHQGHQGFRNWRCCSEEVHQSTQRQ